MAIIAKVEYTDTFAGEANYCWVRRAEFECDNMSDLIVVRKAKSLIGISGLKANANSFDSGDMLARYFNNATVMFITFECED
jgi:hypothetical protein